MKAYIISVMAVTFLGGGIMAIAPKNDTAKNLRLLCSVCMLVCMIFPLLSMAGGFSEYFDKNAIADMFEISSEEKENYDEIYNKYLQSTELKTIEQSLKNQAIKDLSLQNDNFDIVLEINDNNDEFYISKAVLVIYAEGAAQNPRELAEYIQKRTDCKCEIYYDWVIKNTNKI